MVLNCRITRVITITITITRVRRGLNEILKRAELGLAELGDIEHSLEERSRPRCIDR